MASLRSPDGTTLLLSTASHALQTYILPPDLLTPPSPGKQHELAPYATHTFPEPVYATTIYPSYALSSPESCLYISSPRNLPIRLLSPFAPGILASYPLVNPTTEAWVAPHSLLFSAHDSNTFFAGADGFIAIFDLHRNGEEPSARLVTGKGRKRSKGGGAAAMLAAGKNCGLGVRGIVSAMAMNSEGILAAGTFSGHIALLDPYNASTVVGVLPLPADAGNGVTSLHFHPEPSRKYLLASSRLSNAMHVFDVRKPTAPLAVLVGRQAMTQQRLGVDITEDGELWAGGTDGVVRVWKGMGMEEGELEASWMLEAHEDAVGGLGLHPGGAGVLASCAGSRRYGDLEGGLGRSEARSRTRQMETGRSVSDDVSSEEDGSSSSEISMSSTSSKSTTSKDNIEVLKVWGL